MGEAECLTRMAKAHAGIGYAPGGEAQLSDADAARLRAAYADVASWPLTIRADVPRLSQIMADIERAAARGPLALAVVDYLQIVVPDTGKRDASTRDAELSAATRALKALAMRLRIPVLIGSQLNRQADGIRPSLAMLRESGGIESDADAVIALWTPDAENQPNVTEASVIKNRAGETGNAALYFDMPAHRFGAAEVVKL
jgi:replicative DNA helicase